MGTSKSFVAIRGQLHRRAGRLATGRDPARLGRPGRRAAGRGRARLRYANLAVRGKLLDQIVADQVPVAERLRPDLIAFAAGGNDIIRFACDTDDLARRFDEALGRVTATGAQVLVFTGFDVGRMHPLIRRLRGRVACYSELTRASAERHGSTVVDLWGMTPLADPRSWGLDRLHLTEEGHRRVALRTLETLGVPVLDDWRAPFPAADPAVAGRQARRTCAGCATS